MDSPKKETDCDSLLHTSDHHQAMYSPKKERDSESPLHHPSNASSSQAGDDSTPMDSRRSKRAKSTFVVEPDRDEAGTFPGFSKSMVRSNVCKPFWMYIHKEFCEKHLPNDDTIITLENENGEEFKTNYIAHRTSFSGGWKAFCDANQILEGDILHFQLVQPSKFKVYKTKSVKPLQSLSPGQVVHDQFENDNEDLDSNTFDDLGSSSVPTGNFKEVKSIDYFRILVNGLTIDSELSNEYRTKYYNLCRSQNCYLHSHLLNNVNCLAAKVITETVNIAEAIRACGLSSTSESDYEMWDKTLKAFELLGMNVGFLLARLKRLMSLRSELQESVQAKRLREVDVEQHGILDEIKALVMKLLPLKEANQKLESEKESLKAEIERQQQMFKTEADAPW